jgi:hypothetical protein
MCSRQDGSGQAPASRAIDIFNTTPSLTAYGDGRFAGSGPNPRRPLVEEVVLEEAARAIDAGVGGKKGSPAARDAALRVLALAHVILNRAGRRNPRIKRLRFWPRTAFPPRSGI